MRSARRLPAAPRASLLRLLTLLALAPVACALPGSAPGSHPGAEPPVVGPASGSLVVAGGGELGFEIWSRFVELAGGRNARIVVIPTAGADDEYGEDWSGLDPLRAAGARRITLLHTRDREEADSEAFVAPLSEATGVWFPGGRQWRLVDAYMDTRVHAELFALLDRGGVVGGTSAGASILASYLVRGDPETNQVLMAPGYEDGFGLLAGTAVDQHLTARGREDDLWEVLSHFPDLLGIGLDEGTALIVRGDLAEVVGLNQVLIYDTRYPALTPRAMRAGSMLDLGNRTYLPIVAPDDAGRTPFP